MSVPIKAPIQLDAPRQALFAIILLISFCLISTLTVYSLSQTQQNTQKNHGELMVSQLSQTLADTVSAKDTVGIALVSSQYAKLPQINNLQVISLDGKVLSNVGDAPNSQGNEFIGDISQDNEVVGSIKLNLKTPTVGNIIKNQWMVFLGLALVHILLFFVYRNFARQFVVREKVPERAYTGPLMSKAEYAESKKTVNYEADDEALDTISARQAGKEDFTPKANIFSNKPVAIPDYDKMPIADTPGQTELAVGLDRMRLNIQFDDPKNFLPKLALGISKPYYKFCDKLLDNAIDTLLESGLLPKGVSFDKMNFSVAGVSVVALSEDIDKASYSCFLLGQLYLLLHDVTYQKHREIQRFAVPCKACICNNKNIDNLVNILAEDAMANDILILLGSDENQLLKGKIQLQSYKNPQTILQRDIGVVEAVSHDIMKDLSAMRDKILSK